MRILFSLFRYFCITESYCGIIVARRLCKSANSVPLFKEMAAIVCLNTCWVKLFEIETLALMRFISLPIVLFFLSWD